MRTWPARRWLATALASLGVALALGVPTGLVPNPVVALNAPPPAWSRPSLALISLLSGALIATYLTSPVGGATGDGRRRAGMTATAGVYVTICPTCTLLAATALGTGGVATWLQPAQPLLALAAVGLLSFALLRRLRTEGRCRLPAERRNSAA